MVLWIGTSWKMNKTQAEAVSFASRLKDAMPAGGWSGVQPFVIPPATAITAVRDTLGPRSPIVIGAQNAHWEDGGAWTGEVSVPQVADAGASLVEIGHSERREHFGETDHTVNQKVQATLRHGLTALVCVGEPAQTRATGGATKYVLAQVEAALDRVPSRSRVLLAYEPRWAIGERGREPAAEEVAEITDALDVQYGADVSAVLYGGSVTTENAAGLLRTRGVSGLFVGRSAWQVDGYLTLLRIATDVARETGPAPKMQHHHHQHTERFIHEEQELAVRSGCGHVSPRADRLR